MSVTRVTRGETKIAGNNAVHFRGAAGARMRKRAKRAIGSPARGAGDSHGSPGSFGGQRAPASG
jgi:hypothetical protein